MRARLEEAKLNEIGARIARGNFKLTEFSVRQMFVAIKFILVDGIRANNCRQLSPIALPIAIAIPIREIERRALGAARVANGARQLGAALPLGAGAADERPGRALFGEFRLRLRLRGVPTKS